MFNSKTKCKVPEIKFFGVVLLAVSAAAQTQALLDEPSRDDLSLYALSLEGSTRAFPLLFRFPDDTKQGRAFGIDVSHYEGSVDWEKVIDQNVAFAFVKATQGNDYYDSAFSANWGALEKVIRRGGSIHRGAYHFMTAGDPSNTQASNFLNTVGKLTKNDLPPCLDLEWDFTKHKGQLSKGAEVSRVDQWASLSSSQIVEKVKIWLNSVETSTHKRPIIYTNARWWSERIGTDRSLNKYSLWVADYSDLSLKRESPLTPNARSWLLWQLTDRGRLTQGGSGKAIDTSVFKGSSQDLFDRLLHPSRSYQQDK